MDESTQRKGHRFLAGLPGVLHSEDGDFECKAHDLSRSGVLLNGSFPVPCETEVEVTLRSHGADLELRVAGHVARSREDYEREEAELALEFANLDAQAEEALERLISRVMEGVVPTAIAELPPGANVNQIREALTQVPLPHRVNLAGRALPRDREILIHDTAPPVLDALARNPNLNMPEVQKLLRLPQLPPQALDTLSRSKWGSNDELRVLILTHHNASLEMALRLADKLSPAARRKALQRSGIRGAIRARLLKQAGR